jgi:hypothetical protein
MRKNPRACVDTVDAGQREVPPMTTQPVFHLFYNAAVFLPMVGAMYLHLRPSRSEMGAMRCSCPAAAPS